MDNFVEYIVKKRKTFQDSLIVVGVIIGVIIVAFLLLRLPFGPFLAVAAGYGGYLLITSRNIEYEYAVTNGDMDVDKIISQRKRKRILSIHCKEFEVVAPVRDERHQREYTSTSIVKTIPAMSSMEAERLYFAIFTLNGQKCRLIFEPTSKMLEVFKIYIPGKVFE